MATSVAHTPLPPETLSEKTCHGPGEGTPFLGDVLVLGAGRTGLVAAAYLANLVPERVRSVTLVGGAKSYASDATRSLEEAGVSVRLATEEIQGHYDLCVVSPGIPATSPFFLAAKAASTELIGEPELAWRESPERWVAITGTNGKTTTTKLTTALIERGGDGAISVGNIGTVATGEVAGRVPGSWFVAELSSFQLETASLLHPRVACLLNVTPDHLEWHGTMEAYAAAKARVFQNLDERDLAIVCMADAYCINLADELDKKGLRVCRVSTKEEPAGTCAAYVRAGMLVVRLDGRETELVSVDSLSIHGEHNVANALVAAASALEVGVEVSAVREGLVSFAPLEHRIEPVGEVAGVGYVNDSKATNVDAVAKALTSFKPGTVVVLLGGYDKGTELDTLVEATTRTCRVAVCYGGAGPRIAAALRASSAAETLIIVEAPHMAEAFTAARTLAHAGDTILLSPACSSFDEFTSYGERGRRFKELVAALREEETDESVDAMGERLTAEKSAGEPAADDGTPEASGTSAAMSEAVRP